MQFKETFNSETTTTSTNQKQRARYLPALFHSTMARIIVHKIIIIFILFLNQSFGLHLFCTIDKLFQCFIIVYSLKCMLILFAITGCVSLMRKKSPSFDRLSRRKGNVQKIKPDSYDSWYRRLDKTMSKEEQYDQCEERIFAYYEKFEKK